MESPPPCPNTVTVRRNPHRKARPTPSSACPPQLSSKSAGVPSFPTQEILSMDVQSPENLKIFLRIKPLFPSKSFGKNEHHPRSRSKNVWPQKPPSKKTSSAEMPVKIKRKTGDACIAVNDSHSVTLSPPLQMQESKRIKSEVYEGFAHVFAAESSQEEVYEKMVSPLVEDFLKGKSGMLAAMGPSGSGKTHTVFGCPRDPGMLTIALERIFKAPVRRSFYLSIFEIRTEGGKGEKLYDLSPDGSEITLQQSTLKGLKEVMVCNMREAESLVAKALLKRVTATTNSNSQSSRSQCIINIHCADCKNFDGKDDGQVNNATLSIIDLAGAEREKRTGNQGARLLESNFINNTSMVFNLCLRSLLEHQKNPKRPLQKHFQNSLLTRYLRDYLEGKKRMALILTVKSGEEDYLDTAYVLRQASPFMKIKFDNVEELSSSFGNKRQSQALCRNEKPKKMKFGGPDAVVIEKRKSVEDIECLAGQGCLKEEWPQKSKTQNMTDFASVKSNCGSQTQGERNHLILQNVAKAIWNVLKQCNEKLKVAEVDIQSLKENLIIEKEKRTQLEKELADVKSNCTCSKESIMEVSLVDKSNMDLHPSKIGASESECSCTSEKFDSNQQHQEVLASDCNSTPKKNDSAPRQDQDIISQTNVVLHYSAVRGSDCNSTPKKNDSAPRQDQDIISQTNVELHYSAVRASDCNSAPKKNDSAHRQDQDIISKENVDLLHSNIRESEYSSCTSSQSEFAPRLVQDIFSQVKEVTFPSDSKGFQSDDKEQAFVANEDVAPIGCSVADVLDCEPRVDEPEENVDLYSNFRESECSSSTSKQCEFAPRLVRDIYSQSQVKVEEHALSTTVDIKVEEVNFPLGSKGFQSVDKEQTFVGNDFAPVGCTVPDDVLDCRSKVDKSEEVKNQSPMVSFSSKPKIPKRRLLPASTALIRDFTILDLNDETEKPKGNRGGKKVAADERKRTPGSISLLRLLHGEHV